MYIGDTEVGEALRRAREWINEGVGRWVAMGVGGAFVLVAGVLVVRALFHDTTDAPKQRIRERGRRALYFCQECRRTGETRIGYGDEFPIECPHCGKQAAAAAFRCVKCGNIIEQRSEPVYECPHCHYVYDNRAGGPAAGPAGRPP